MGLTASQKGRLAETLIGAYCVLGSDGALNVSTPFVDDAGVDLICNLKGGSRNISLQVKSRFTLTGRGQFRAHVRKKALVPRNDLYLLFVFIDEKNFTIGDNLWLVPSKRFVNEVRGQSKPRSIYVFASKFAAENDMWRKYRLPKSKLPAAIVAAIKEA